MRLVINTGRPVGRSVGQSVAVVARELGIVEQVLGNWVKAYRARHEAGVEALTEAKRAELVRLRKENSELKMGRAFLKSFPVLRPGSIGYEREAFKLMHADKSNFTVKRMAWLLEVSRSGLPCLAETGTPGPGGPASAHRAEGGLVPQRL